MDTLRCDVCGRDDFKQPAGLASHVRSKHPLQVDGSNTEACERTLAVLSDTGRLEAVDAARVQAVRTLAQVVDERPTNPQLWQQYREALGEVLDADVSADSDLEQAVAAIRSAT